MKTVKFNEEEVELLVAFYEDELKEANSYIEKLAQTLKKLKEEAAVVKSEPTVQGKKRGPKPKHKTALLEEPKKRGRKKKIQLDSITDITASEGKKGEKKKRGRKPKNITSYKPVVKKSPVIDAPVTEA